MVATLEELCHRYQNLYSGLVADVLDDRGYEDQILSSDVGPLVDGMKAVGVAYPAEARRNRSVEYDAQAEALARMLRNAPEHSVAIVQANDTESAQIGELTTAALAEQGCRGVVVDGGVRDSAIVREQDFPVFHRSKSPADSLVRSELIEWGTETVVGGVAVSPGDFVFGDVDGVVIVPEEVVEPVLAEAEEKMDTENHLRQAIRDGTDPLEAYREFGTF
jgi:regulator of RNase E activity RraA